MKKNKWVVISLIALTVLLGVFPLIIITDSDFGGADGQANALIEEINPTYTPWAEPLMEPPGSETESLLFSLQAALGAGVLGLGFGYLIGRKEGRKESLDTEQHQHPL